LLTFNSYSQYNSNSDSIIINTKKQIDTRNYLNSSANIPESTINCKKSLFPTLKGIPDTLNNISLFVCPINTNQAFFQSFKLGRINEKEFNNWSVSIRDTNNCYNEYINTYVSILTGRGSDSTLFYIPETNNNYDFSDEKAYKLELGPIWSPTYHEILKLFYEKFRNNKKVLDSTFVTVARSIDDMIKNSIKIENLVVHINESRYSSFTYNNINYNLVITPDGGSTAFYDKNCRLYFYSEEPDFCLFKLPYLKPGENIQLDKTYYQISKIEDNGEKVILVKE
jgi:hypothetical protein